MTLYKSGRWCGSPCSVCRVGRCEMKLGDCLHDIRQTCVRRLLLKISLPRQPVGQFPERSGHLDEARPVACRMRNGEKAETCPAGILKSRMDQGQPIGIWMFGRPAAKAEVAVRSLDSPELGTAKAPRRAPRLNRQALPRSHVFAKNPGDDRFSLHVFGPQIRHTPCNYSNLQGPVGTT